MSKIPESVQYVIVGAGVHGLSTASLYIARFQGHIQELLVSSLSTLEVVLALVPRASLAVVCAIFI